MQCILILLFNGQLFGVELCFKFRWLILCKDQAHIEFGIDLWTTGLTLGVKELMDDPSSEVFFERASKS